LTVSQRDPAVKLSTTISAVFYGLCLACKTFSRKRLLSFFRLADEAMDVAVRSVSQGDRGSVRTIEVFQFKVKGAVGHSVLCHFITSEGFGRGRDLQYRMKLCCRASGPCGSKNRGCAPFVFDVHSSACQRRRNQKPARASSTLANRVTVNLRTEKIVEATIMAVVPKGNSIRLQVDYEKDRTALVYEWQVVEKLG
jgi:hypothetical protein